MICFGKLGWKDRIFDLWPSNRKRREEATRKAIKFLIENPSEPCGIEGQYIPHGYGKHESLSKSILGFDLN